MKKAPTFKHFAGTSSKYIIEFYVTWYSSPRDIRGDDVICDALTYLCKPRTMNQK